MPPSNLRKDALANRAKILTSAQALFDQQLCTFKMDEVAIHANIAVGTLYRHFNTKTELLQTLVAGQCDAMVDELDGIIATRDAWGAFQGLMEEGPRYYARFELLHGLGFQNELFSECKKAIYVRMTDILETAQAAGVVRADMRPTDFPPLFSMITTSVLASHHIPAHIRGRAHQVLIDGCRPHNGVHTHPEIEMDRFSVALYAIGNEQATAVHDLES
jgi:AcrR family transcriptional regulator